MIIVQNALSYHFSWREPLYMHHLLGTRAFHTVVSPTMRYRRQCSVWIHLERWQRTGCCRAELGLGRSPQSG
jgi:hypothetical protein